MLIIRLVGFPPFTLANYLAGLSRLPSGTYLAATLLGVLPWIVFITYISDALWKVLRTAGMAGFKEALAQHGRPLTLGLVMMAGVVGLTYFMKRRAAPSAGPGGS
jgi:sulfoquinovosyltransferase